MDTSDTDSGSDDEEAQSGSDSSSGTQMASGEGGSVDVGNLIDSVGAAAGAKCTLMAGDTFHSVSLVANLKVANFCNRFAWLAENCADPNKTEVILLFPIKI